MSQDGVPGGGYSERVMPELKDFQRDAVDYVFSRLYGDADAARRFLVASETGLGKTLVARGVIARALDHLHGKVGRIDVLYICSNADIARQNINRLNVTGRSDFGFAGRITMLPLTMHRLEQGGGDGTERVNFISFTPGTTFDLKSSTGLKEERALLYHLLRGPWGLGGRAAPKNVLRAGAGSDGFRNLLRNSGEYWEIDEGLQDLFRRDLQRRVEDERARGVDDLRTRFERLCAAFKRHTSDPPGTEHRERTRVIGELRWQLATSCLAALEPDLIILDEFQRFKHLLDGRDAASELARRLFEWGDAKTLLLSATPYKMYTLRHESETDDHYTDFLRTLEFLEFGSGDSEPLQDVLADYRRSLFRLGPDGSHHDENGDLAPVTHAKNRLERRLRRTMLRTEKLASTQDRNGMLAEVPPRSRLEPSDLKSYVSLRHVLDSSVGGDAMEYWKSAPYMLNFMEGYKFKHRVGERIGAATPELYGAMASSESLLLDWEDVRAYKRVDPANARLRELLADTVDSRAWKLLWLPPSQPYYGLEGHFREAAEKGFTKRLVFSSWRVVPKIIAGLASYEAERRMTLSYSPQARNTAEAHKRRSSLLSFSVDRTAGTSGERGGATSRLGRDGEDRLTGMPVLGILYPSVTLAGECDPLVLARELGASGPEADRGRLPKETEIRELAKSRIAALLGRVCESSDTFAPVDEAWYWAAPVLLDKLTSEDATRSWFSQPELAKIWSDHEEGRGEGANWARHVHQAGRLLAPDFDPGSLGGPPEDLADVLASLALGGPGACALRALSRIAEGANEPVLRNSAARISWNMRSLFNLPESMHLVRSMAGGER